MGESTAGDDTLKRVIGFPSAVLLVIGGMVGVGVFVNPAVVARSVSSPGLIIGAWALGGAMAILGAFVYAELAARLPGAGGEYVYLKETLGPLPAFLFGWTTLLVVQAGGMAAVAIVFVKNLSVLLGQDLPAGPAAAATILALAAVNCLGVRSGNGVQAVLGILKMAAIGALILVGLLFVRPSGVSAPPVAASSFKAFGAAMVPVVFSYGGWQTASMVSGEMKDAARGLSRAILIGVLTVIAIYLLVTFVCLRALGPAGLAATSTPASDVLRLAFGPMGAAFASAAIAVSALGFLSQSMLTAPRVSFAMARDGLFFRQLGATAAWSKAPVAAILLQGVWTAGLALSGAYDRILSYVTAMNFLFFGLNGVCVFILRRRRATGDAPAFTAPLHPLTTGLFILACALIVLSAFWSYPLDSLMGYAILILGAPVYFAFRRRLKKEDL